LQGFKKSPTLLAKIEYDESNIDPQKVSLLDETNCLIFSKMPDVFDKSQTIWTGRLSLKLNYSALEKYKRAEAHEVREHLRSHLPLLRTFDECLSGRRDVIPTIISLSPLEVRCLKLTCATPSLVLNKEITQLQLQFLQNRWRLIEKFTIISDKTDASVIELLYCLKDMPVDLDELFTRYLMYFKPNVK
jgi:hypothetical protein